MTRVIYVQCPECKKHFQVEGLYWTAEYDLVKLMCAFCLTEFPKEKSPEVVGLS